MINLHSHKKFPIISKPLLMKSFTASRLPLSTAILKSSAPTVEISRALLSVIAGCRVFIDLDGDDGVPNPPLFS